MAGKSSPVVPTVGELVIARVFDAPRELVWKAWTEQDRLAQWWGPKGLTMGTCRMGLRPSGIFHYSMIAPNGQEMWGKWVIREVVAPERLVVVVSFSDETGGVRRHPMAATWPLEMLLTVTLVEHAGQTTITMKSTPINATPTEVETFDAGRDSVIMGTKGTLDQLEAYLAKVQG